MLFVEGRVKVIFFVRFFFLVFFKIYNNFVCIKKMNIKEKCFKNYNNVSFMYYVGIFSLKRFLKN